MARTAIFQDPNFDEQAEAQNIEQQRKYAELLRQQSMQGMGEGKMVGRTFVPPSWTQGLAQMLNAYNSRATADNANERQKALAEAVRGRNANEMGEFTNLITGRPADVLPEGASGPVRQAQAPDLGAAYRYAATAKNPALQQFGVQGALTQAQEQAKLAQAQTVKQQQLNLWQQAGGDPQKFIQLGGDISMAEKLAEAPTWGKPKSNPATDLMIPDPANPGKFIRNDALIGVKKEIGAAGASRNSNTVINKGPEAFDIELSKLDAKQLDQWRDKSEQARSSLSTAQRLRAAEAEGAYSGGGANAKLAAANLINGITGANIPGLVGSQTYNSEASKLVLEHIKGLGANPSNADREFIERTVPQLATSKEARQALVDYIEQSAGRTIQTFEAMDTHARKNKGLGGFKMPTASPLPDNSQKPASVNNSSVTNW